MKNKLLFIVTIVLMLGVLNVSSAFCGVCDIITFALTPTYLETMFPTEPVTWQATIQNTSYNWFATDMDYGFEFLDPDPAIGTLMFESGLPTVLGPQQVWHGDFATFDFFDTVPLGARQEIRFSVFGNSTCPKGQFETQYQIGTAAVVPEPSSLILLFSGLLGLAGYRVVKRKKE
jgi:hypothetical protein